MNGQPIIAMFGGVVFVRLPAEQQRAIDSCSCPYCEAHPDETPRWDTVAVPTDGRHGHTWTVHMPDPVESRRTADRLGRGTPPQVAPRPRRRVEACPDCGSPTYGRCYCAKR